MSKRPKGRNYPKLRESKFKKALKNISPEAKERVRKHCEQLMKENNV